MSVKNLIQYRLFYGYIFRTIKKYLSNGFYYFDTETSSFSRFSFSKCGINKLLLKSFIKCNFLSKNSKLANEYAPKKGIHKLVVIDGEYTYCFYKSRDYYIKSKNGYSLIPLLGYPCVNVMFFNDRKRYAKQFTVLGKPFFDSFHDDILINNLIEYINCGNFIVKDNLIFMLQHGDMKRDCAFWNNDSSFMFIDIDDVGYYPLFYDVIHYLLTAPVQPCDIIEILKEKAKIIEPSISKLGLSFDDIFIDDIFYNYIIWCKNVTYKDSYRQELILFEKQFESLFFLPKTYNIINEIYKTH